ncbi:MAG TPA: MFS transporter [Chloroflexota bacterium]
MRRVDYKWQAAIIVALGLFLSVLDSTIVSVALPVMRNEFHTDFNTITWIVSAYFLAQAAVIPITGYLWSKRPLAQSRCRSNPDRPSSRKEPLPIASISSPREACM